MFGGEQIHIFKEVVALHVNLSFSAEWEGAWDVAHGHALPERTNYRPDCRVEQSPAPVSLVPVRTPGKPSPTLSASKDYGITQGSRSRLIGDREAWYRCVIRGGGQEGAARLVAWGDNAT